MNIHVWMCAMHESYYVYMTQVHDYTEWMYNWHNKKELFIILYGQKTNVADPEYFDADPDHTPAPDPKKSGS